MAHCFLSGNRFATLAISFFLLCHGGSSQTLKAVLKPEPMSREVMYRLLFREVASFEAKANEFVQQGKPDAFLRQHHRLLLDLNDSEDIKLEQVSILCATQVRDVDTQAAALINAVKSQYRHAARGSANVLVPPPPQALLDLEAKRTALVLAAADSLASSFGPANFALFESHVRQYMGSNYRAVPQK